MGFRRTVFFLLALGLMLLGCRHGDNGTGLFAEPESRTLSGTGRILFHSVEGGCWTIQSSDGNSYEPIGLSDAFKKDGLAVQFTVKTLPDVRTICMVGDPVEVVDIQALAGP